MQIYPEPDLIGIRRDLFIIAGIVPLQPLQKPVALLRTRFWLERLLNPHLRRLALDKTIFETGNVP